MHAKRPRRLVDGVPPASSLAPRCTSSCPPPLPVFSKTPQSIKINWRRVSLFKKRSKKCSSILFFGEDIRRSKLKKLPSNTDCKPPRHLIALARWCDSDRRSKKDTHCGKCFAVMESENVGCECYPESRPGCCCPICYRHSCHSSSASTGSVLCGFATVLIIIIIGIGVNSGLLFSFFIYVVLVSITVGVADCLCLTFCIDDEVHTGGLRTGPPTVVVLARHQHEEVTVLANATLQPISNETGTTEPPVATVVHKMPLLATATEV
jgi:hypothetical protein